jgi:hypothetical protein
MVKQSLVACGILFTGVSLLHCSADDSKVVGTGGTSGSSSAAGAPMGGEPILPQAGANAGQNGDVAPSAGGGGGMSGTGSGGARHDCEADFPECCQAPDGLPCRNMSEGECKALNGRYCMAVMGVPYQEGGLGGAGLGYDDAEYIGCFSVCSGDLPVESCTQNPEMPDACYHTPSAAAPDGWKTFDCGSPPTGCTE